MRILQVKSFRAAILAIALFAQPAAAQMEWALLGQAGLMLPLLGGRQLTSAGGTAQGGWRAGSTLWFGRIWGARVFGGGFGRQGMGGAAGGGMVELVSSGALRPFVGGSFGVATGKVCFHGDICGLVALQVASEAGVTWRPIQGLGLRAGLEAFALYGGIPVEIVLQPKLSLGLTFGG